MGRASSKGKRHYSVDDIKIQHPPNPPFAVGETLRVRRPMFAPDLKVGDLVEVIETGRCPNTNTLWCDVRTEDGRTANLPWVCLLRLPPLEQLAEQAK